MGKLILIVFACLSFSCQGEVKSSYTDSEIYEVILTEIIQSDSFLIESFEHAEFHDITLKKNDSDYTEIEELNMAYKSYSEKHGNTLAIRIGSTQEIDGRILNTNFLTFEESRLASLEKEEKEAYQNLLQTINSKIELEIPSEVIIENLSFNGRNVKLYRTTEENSVSMHEFSVSQIGFSLDKQYGCFYVGSHPRGMAGNGGLIFIIKVEDEWRINKSLDLWVA